MATCHSNKLSSFNLTRNPSTGSNSMDLNSNWRALQALLDGVAIETSSCWNSWKERSTTIIEYMNVVCDLQTKRSRRKKAYSFLVKRKKAFSGEESWPEEEPDLREPCVSL